MNNKWSTASADTLIDQLVDNFYVCEFPDWELFDEIARRLGELERLQ
jgi:hypothetical protein